VTRLDRYAYCAGAILTALIGVELAHRYGLRLLDVGWRTAERTAHRLAR
jgi:hypothetical protein